MEWIELVKELRSTFRNLNKRDASKRDFGDGRTRLNLPKKRSERHEDR